MLKVFEAFAGYGSQRMALRNLGIEHEVVAISEIDKFSIASYKAIHGETNNLGDISKINVADVPEHDLFTYSFPCQDISVAGNQKGFDRKSGTRSGLLWECERIISSVKPKYLLMENVKNLVSKKFKPGFQEWVAYLESLGYSNYWEVLNAKNFGIPQNRERVFMVSILGEHEPYVFPKPIKLEKRLKDVLEEEVDEKYYLDNERVQQLIATIADVKDTSGVIEPEIKQVGNTTPNPKRENPQTGRTYDADGLAPTLNTMQGGNRQPQIIEPKLEFIGGLKEGKKWLDDGKDNSRNFSQGSRVYDSRGLATTLTAQGVGGKGGHSGLYKVPEPKIAVSRGRNPENSSDRTKGAPTEQRLEVNDEGTSNTLTTVQKDNYVLEGIPIKNNTNQGYLIAKEGDGVDLAYPTSNTRRGRVQKSMSQTLTTDDSKGVVEQYRIRKLTPLECFRLMDVTDEDFYKAAYKTKQITFKEDNEEWNVRLKDVTGNQKPGDTETFVLNITNDSNEQVETSIEWTKCLKVLGKEKKQNVNIAIEKLAELGHSDYATSIIKCTETMENLTTLTEEKGPLQTVIIELDEKASSNTAKYMKITSGENLNPLKLFITLILLKQIIESRISISTLQQVNICGFIENMNASEKNMGNQLRLSLKTDATFTRNSASQFYKQAGNSIVVSVLEAIFRNMFLEVSDRDLIGEHIPLF